MATPVEFQRELARLFFKTIKFGQFKLAVHRLCPDAPLSPFKIDLREPPEGFLTPEDVRLIAEELLSVVETAGVEFDLVCGIPKTGEPFARIISQFSGKPQLSLRKAEEGSFCIVGSDHALGQRVLLVDDVIAHGSTKELVINVLWAAGLIIAALLVTVDREQGGAKELKKKGHTVLSIFSVYSLFEYYYEVNLIDVSTWRRVVHYLVGI